MSNIDNAVCHAQAEGGNPESTGELSMHGVNFPLKYK